MTEELTGQELIKTFLESTYIHYTAAEIYEFFEESKDELKNQLKISTIRKYLQELSVRDEIVELSIEGKRDKYYIAKSSEETLYINIELIGLYIHHYDSTKLLDCIIERKNIKDVRETPLPQNSTIKDFYLTPIELNGKEKEMDRKMLKKISFFEGITMMNYHDIPKIVGINTFQRHKDHTVTGVQRPRQKQWVKELRNGLSAHFSALVTNSILYFNINYIEEVEPPNQREDGLLVWKIRVPFKNHIPDNKKPGWIIDGQQRMWALDYVNLRRLCVENRESIKFFGPVTILIGDFEGVEDFEPRMLKLLFVFANETKNLPKTLKQEMAALMGPEMRKSFREKVQFESFIYQIIDQLESSEKSPFYNEIDHTIKSFNKSAPIITDDEGNNTRKFTEKGIFDMIDLIIKERPFSYKTGIVEFQSKINDWTKIIIDYFTAIKSVFYDDWNDPESIIKRNLIISVIGKLIKEIWENSFNRIESEARIKIIIELLSQWIDQDDGVDFGRHSSIKSSFPRDLKKVFNKAFYEITQRFSASTMVKVGSGAEAIIDDSIANYELIKMQINKRIDEKLGKKHKTLEM